MVDLRLPLDDFWRLTPREFEAFHCHFAQANKRDYELVGVLASHIANYSMRHPEKWLEPCDIFQGLKPKSATVSLAPSGDRMADYWGALRIGVGKRP